jgi:molybdopterin synthase catalytic subunit
MLRRIAEEAETRWGCEVVIQHRIGRIELGEASVVVAVGSPHRAQAFEACRYCIDTLKETVPIWKREVCPDGAYWIEGEDALKAEDGHGPCAGAADSGRGDGLARL